jgi:hypothetical protein
MFLLGAKNSCVEEAIYFIKNAQSRGVIVDNCHTTSASPSFLAEKQRLAFEMILRHSVQYESHEPLLMIV